MKKLLDYDIRLTEYYESITSRYENSMYLTYITECNTIVELVFDFRFDEYDNMIFDRKCITILVVLKNGEEVYNVYDIINSEEWSLDSIIEVVG